MSVIDTVWHEVVGQINGSICSNPEDKWVKFVENWFKDTI